MIEPGDVITALLPGVSETKRRPAVVISTPAYHAARPDVILALITGRVEKADTDFDCVLFDWEPRASSSHRRCVPFCSPHPRVKSLTTGDCRTPIGAKSGRG